MRKTAKRKLVIESDNEDEESSYELDEVDFDHYDDESDAHKV